jgi:hypothetical protein
VRRGGNKDGRFLEVAAYGMGGRRGFLLILDGRGWWGWHKFASELRKAKDFLFAKIGCGFGSSSLAEKKGGKEGPGLGMVLNCMGPSFVEVVRSDSCPDATVMPIVGGFPSSVVWSEPLPHTRL